MDSASSKDGEDTAMVLMKAMTECNETYPIDNSYIQSLNESGSFPDETERTPKCYVRCVMEKVGAATEEGVYDPTRVMSFMELFRMNQQDKSGFKDIAEQCNDRKETCKCDRAYQYMKCIAQNQIKKYGA
ncbi:uncharacterized protein LOC106137085 [Amyelois transitella]|uniref:uncharacterized protein LOC106137085 n=1 Tax=Amyelois transitella TaxID=680683 RepID=UPI00067B01F6|nr:uncharacterized protein LOC106137085 [Amyelois transitella]